MVVAQIVRIQNTTLRTFMVSIGSDTFAGFVSSTPSVGDRPCADGQIEVTPGFDQPIENLFLPWEQLTTSGLVISAVSPEQVASPDVEVDKEVMRCVVGPVDFDVDARDWLRCHNADWEPLAQEGWVPLGRRHLLGAIGGAVEIQLSFRNALGTGTEEQANLVDICHFERASHCAPSNTVFLNVFDLVSALSIPNAILCNTTVKCIGAFHAAVEVYGEEWSFYRTPRADTCGVCKSLRPRQHPVHIFRQSLNLGQTTLKEWEVRYLIRQKLAPKWLGGGYDLLHRNCIHFCDELLLSLGAMPVPAWVRGLHETGGFLSSVLSPLAYVFGIGGDAPRALQDGDDQDDDDNQSQGFAAHVSPSARPSLSRDNSQQALADESSNVLDVPPNEGADGLHHFGSNLAEAASRQASPFELRRSPSTRSAGALAAAAMASRVQKGGPATKIS